MTTGAVHEDKFGELISLRNRFAYYPHDIWLYLLAATWQRIGQEEHLVLRAAYVGDEIGSAIIASRLVRDIIHLCFLMERKYAPYAKWFGTAFQQLKCYLTLAPILIRVQLADTWKTREKALCEAYIHVAQIHNSIGGIDQLSDNTDMREQHVSPIDSTTSWRHVLKKLYTEVP